MAKRLLDCTASDLVSFGKKELLESMAGCEGRVMVSETIGITQPLLNDVTNAEYAAALGADVLLLNMFDVQKPVIQALPKVLPENATDKEVTWMSREPEIATVDEAASSASIWSR